MKTIITAALLSITCVSLKAQKAIVYSFEKPVADSLLKGIKWYEKAYKKEWKDLKLLALLVRDFDTTQIVLVEYSPLNLNGLQELVKRTNRKLRVTTSIFLPILFPSDEHSVQFQSDHMQNLPYGGFSVLIQYDKHKIVSIQTSQQF